MAVLLNSSPVGTLGTVAIIAATVYLLQIPIKSLASPLRHLPGPWYTRFTHLRLKYAIITGDRTFYIHDLHQRYGPIVRISPDEVAVIDLESFQKIHKVGSGYPKSPWYHKFTDLAKDGVFTTVSNKEHSTRRKELARPFSRSYLVEHWDGTIREKCALAVEKIKKEAIDGDADIFTWLMFMSSDVMSNLVFGESFQNLETGAEALFTRKIKKATMGGGIGAELPILRYLKHVPLESIQEIFNGNDYITEVVNRAIETAKTRKGESNLFAKIIDDRRTGQGTLDDADVQVESISVLVAGTDTTSVTLTYLIWMVLQRPDLQAKLEAEVQSLADGFSETDVQKLPLLNAVIEETLRLYGAAPASLPRTVPDAGAEMCGYFIPGGTTVSTQAWSMHRDPSIWPNPLAFDPTRWLSEMPQDAKTSFHPFGAGARVCLGVHIARMELRYVTALFFRECKGAHLSARTTPETMEPINFFLIAPKGQHCYITMA